MKQESTASKKWQLLCCTDADKPDYLAHTRLQFRESAWEMGEGGWLRHERGYRTSAFATMIPLYRNVGVLK